MTPSTQTHDPEAIRPTRLQVRAAWTVRAGALAGFFVGTIVGFAVAGTQVGVPVLLSLLGTAVGAGAGAFVGRESRPPRERKASSPSPVARPAVVETEAEWIVPPGWYPDPRAGVTGKRYWDGESWSDEAPAPA